MSTVEDLPLVLTPGEVAVLFRVSPKSVTRWATQIDPETHRPRVPSFTTVGGHRRFRRDDILPLLEQQVFE